MKKLYAFEEKRNASLRRRTTRIVIPRSSTIFKRSASTMLIGDTKLQSQNSDKNENARLKKIKSARSINIAH